MADNTEDFDSTEGAEGGLPERDDAFEEMLSRAEADYDADDEADDDDESGEEDEDATPALSLIHI